MEYLFMETNNPAYRFFTIKFFTEGGIDYVDEYMDSERAQAICREIQLKKVRTHAESLFCTYVGRPDSDPQRLLGSISTLEVIYGRMNAAKMRKLESKLPTDSRTKLVLTKREAAVKIFDFYNGTLRLILADDLKSTDRRRIFDHIQNYDEDKLPDARTAGKQKVDEAARAFVEKLLLWVNEVTPEGVLGDIDRVLEEHERTPDHSETISVGNRKHRLLCHHTSRYVQLAGHPGNNANVPLHLWPSRSPVHDEMYGGPTVDVPVFEVDRNPHLEAALVE